MKASRAEGNRIHFWCPGCDQVHGITYGDPATCWTWNDSLDAPTFTPSVLVNGLEGTASAEWKAKHPRCHSFVTDGRIQFLTDSTHQLAGQTVDLPEWPYSDTPSKEI